jgi:NTP pyrophosphatase (non-canonical NTP hydrolase)
MDSLNEYVKFQKKTSKEDWDLNYLAIGLGGEMGEILNEIKKIKRDDGGELTNMRKKNIEKEMGDLMWYFVGISNKLNISLEELLKTNMDKNKLKISNS